MLTVRPKPYNGEALTSYFIRVSEVNKIDYQDLLFLFILPTTKKKNFTDGKIDIFPSKFLNLHTVSETLNVEIDRIKQMTFTWIVEKLINGLACSLDKAIGMVKKLVSYQNRVYCPYCVGKKEGYQLLWQVININFCPIHLCYLNKQCIQCNHSQTYIDENLSLYCCSSCRISLVYTLPELKYLQDEHITQLFRIKIWKQLLQKGNQLSPEVYHLSKERSLYVAIYYSIEYKLNVEQIHYYNLFYIEKIIKPPIFKKSYYFVTGFNKQSVFILKHIIEILEKINLDFNDFLLLKVPYLYAASLARFTNHS